MQSAFVGARLLLPPLAVVDVAVETPKNRIQAVLPSTHGFWLALAAFRQDLRLPNFICDLAETL